MKSNILIFFPIPCKRLDIQLPLSLFASGDTMLCEDLFYLFIRRKQFVISNFTDVDKVIEKLLFKG